MTDNGHEERMTQDIELAGLLSPFYKDIWTEVFVWVSKIDP